MPRGTGVTQFRVRIDLNPFKPGPGAEAAAAITPQRLARWELVLGTLIVYSMIGLATAIAFWHAEEQTSFGLSAMLAFLGKFTMDFSEWAFRTPRPADAVENYWKLTLGSTIIFALIVLAGAIGVGTVTDKTSFGLMPIIGFLGKFALDFSGWAFPHAEPGGVRAPPAPEAPATEAPKQA